MNINPKYDYCLGKKIVKDSGVVTGTDIRDTHQRYEILAVGPGRMEYGVFVTPTVEVGDIVLTQEHAEADTPQELLDKDLALFMCSRVMAVETHNINEAEGNQ